MDGSRGVATSDISDRNGDAEPDRAAGAVRGGWSRPSAIERIGDLDAFRARWAAGESVRALARAYDMGGRSIVRAAEKLGLPRQPKRVENMISDLPAFRAAWVGLESAEDLSKRFGISVSSVYVLGEKLGLPRRDRRRAYRRISDLPAFRKMWDDQVPIERIAREFGVAESTVYRTARRIRLGDERRGDVAPQRDLVDSVDFRTMWAGPMTTTEIAREYGFSQQAICAAARRWGLPARAAKHLTDLTPPETVGPPILSWRDLPDFEFAKLARSVGSLEDIATAYGVHLSTVGKRMRRQGLTPSTAPRAARVAVPRPERAAVPDGGPCRTEFWTPARDAKVIEAQGKYAAINPLADAWGVTPSRIVARWHLLRAA